MEKFRALFLEKIWYNLDFWHVIFFTVLVSILCIQLFSIIEKHFGSFKKFKQYDLSIYKKLSSFLSEEEFIRFLDELQNEHKCNSDTLQKIGDFEGLLNSPSNIYKSDILKALTAKLVKDLDFLKRFVAINFSEDLNADVLSHNYMFLLPEAQKDLRNQDKQKLLEQEAELKETAAQLQEEKKSFYLQKERELKELAQTVRDDYISYRSVIKKYLNV